jgi:hypothetical protein
MAKQTPKTSLLNKVHACDQCLQSFAESNPGKEPLVPGPSAASSAKACCQCGFLLTSSFLLGLCRICERGFLMHVLPSLDRTSMLKVKNETAWW